MPFMLKVDSGNVNTARHEVWVKTS
jgi:hypothetical protein